MHGLVELGLSGLSIETTSGLRDLTKLVSLDLSHCRGLTDVDGLVKLIYLRELNLSQCAMLQNVDGLSGLEGLTALGLSKCTSLVNVNGLQSLRGLTSLDLSRCSSLVDLSGLASMTGLAELVLCGCTSLETIEPLEGLQRLTELDMSGCTSLVSVAPLATLAQLVSLDLSNAPYVRDLDALSECTALASLVFDGDPPLAAAVLASCAYVRRDESFVRNNVDYWLRIAGLARDANLLVQRLSHAFSIAGKQDWGRHAFEQLVSLVTGRADVSDETWAQLVSRCDATGDAALVELVHSRSPEVVVPVGEGESPKSEQPEVAVEDTGNDVLAPLVERILSSPEIALAVDDNALSQFRNHVLASSGAQTEAMRRGLCEMLSAAGLLTPDQAKYIANGGDEE